ncbi:hypothetical protein [Streptomyces sp. NPDC048385]|uniref:hypothetical protein n=1 Tax=unclassified Streptomyces TaxID=2593676 RepID=UPI003449FAD4
MSSSARLPSCTHAKSRVATLPGVPAGTVAVVSNDEAEEFGQGRRVAPPWPALRAQIPDERIRAVTDRLDGPCATRIERITVLTHPRTGVRPLPLLQY